MSSRKKFPSWKQLHSLPVLTLTGKIAFALDMGFSCRLTHPNLFAECSCKISIYPTHFVRCSMAEPTTRTSFHCGLWAFFDKLCSAWDMQFCTRLLNEHSQFECPKLTFQLLSMLQCCSFAFDQAWCARAWLSVWSQLLPMITWSAGGGCSSSWCVVSHTSCVMFYIMKKTLIFEFKHC